MIFLERTDSLAAREGISLRGLAPRLGLSVASLFGYRNGSIPISQKAWKKLEQAESESQGPIRSNPALIGELTTEERLQRMETLFAAVAKQNYEISQIILEMLDYSKKADR